MEDWAREGSLEELRLQVEQLRASRARMVAAADAESRRIERDLHDGVQQHLVALAVNLQLARQLADTDPGEAKKLLERIGHDVREALEGVRELAQSVYPPQVEATVYFCCLEALENAARHAGAGARATVTAWHEPDALRFEVLDDGVGFEQHGDRQAGGLTSMGDRIGALGGLLTVSSRPDRGTRVSGTVPLAR